MLKKPTNETPYPMGMRIYGRKGSDAAREYGVVVGEKACNLEGCRGLRLCVRWADGKRSWPCTKGLTNHRYGMQIA